MNRVVVLLARAPSARGKTRLTAGWPEDRARALRERLLLDTLTAARAAGYPIVVSFTPDDAREELRGLVGETRLVAQRGDDLGARMRNATSDAFASGANLVVLIGSDLPTLPPRHIVNAFDMLEGVGFLTADASPKAVGPADLVLGPSEDGGFYLVGARQQMPDIFGDIEWSGHDVLARVVAAANALGVTVGLADEWWDVDVPDDLRRCPEYEQFCGGNP
jgi:rSAM/selenodomain-associated transferase 1